MTFSQAPVPTDFPTPAPASVSWRTLGVSVRGSSHEKTGQPCQDVVLWRTLRDGILLAAVADGAGSAALSEMGAALAAAAALDFLESRLKGGELPASDEDWRLLLKSAAAQARESVVAEAGRRSQPARDFASTLLLLIATPDLAAALQIGDGAALVSDGPDALAPMIRPAASEYLNETTFLTSENAVESAAIEIRRGVVRRIALFTDGLQMLALKMPSYEAHPPFFAPLFRFLEAAPDLTEAREQLKVFLNSPRIRQRADDDLTLFLAMRGEGG